LKKSTTEGVAPVVIIFLDMLGYKDAFNGQGEVWEYLPSLSAFSQVATVYHNAKSAGEFTGTAMPGFILQEEVGYSAAGIGRGEMRWPVLSERGTPLRAALEFPKALPRRCRAAGRRAVYIGYYIPYVEAMPKMWDGVFSPSFVGIALPVEWSPFEKAMLGQAVQYLLVSKGPVAAVAKQFRLYHAWQVNYVRGLAHQIHKTGKNFIRKNLSSGDLLVLHLSIPHIPFVFDEKGGAGPKDFDSAEGFPGQLRYADTLFGEWVMALQDAGWWDASWVVATSDHGSHLNDWSANPDGKRHVPFMVKAPGQTGRRDQWTPFSQAEFDRIPGFPVLNP
jgi:hypothetical protein